MINPEDRTHPPSLPPLQQIAHADGYTNLTRRDQHLRLRPPASSTFDGVNVSPVVRTILKCRRPSPLTFPLSDEIIPHRDSSLGFSELGHFRAVSRAPTLDIAIAATPTTQPIPR